MLTHEDHSDLHRLAAHADCLVAFGGFQDIVAATVEQPQQEEIVAAIQHKGKQQNRNHGKTQQKTKPPLLPPCLQGGQWSTDSAPSTVAREATGLCFYH